MNSNKERVLKNRVVVFFGPPGVGKGTITTRLAKEFGCRTISSGDLLRENVKGGTDLGNQAKKFMDSGGLVPDQLVTRMVMAGLEKTEGCVFLDGFPRTIVQAKELAAYLEERNWKLLVIDLEADDEFLMARLTGRLVCGNCGAIYHQVNLLPKKEGVCDVCGGGLYRRADDHPDVVATRLSVYHQQSAPLRDYYQELGLMVTLRGDNFLDKTLAAVRDVLVNIS
ncbi:MAG: nucleoside monophosphate kinase [Candidatus Ratteibacteria bacterium]|jgi:adenylate kinase